MHTNILTPEQESLIPLLQSFAGEYCLVGGTAIALQIGHRRSIDFDLFTSADIKRKSIKHTLEKKEWHVQEIIYEAFDQMHLIVNSVKITFFSYPFSLKCEVAWNHIIKMPSLLDLAAMKAYALGGKAKWRDYVDLYFIMKDHCSLNTISLHTQSMYGNFFNKKLFQEQLTYFEDIDYSEEVIYIQDAIPTEKIKEFLIDVATREM